MEPLEDRLGHLQESVNECSHSVTLALGKATSSLFNRESEGMLSKIEKVDQAFKSVFDSCGNPSLQQDLEEFQPLWNSFVKNIKKPRNQTKEITPECCNESIVLIRLLDFMLAPYRNQTTHFQPSPLSMKQQAVLLLSNC